MKLKAIRNTVRDFVYIGIKLSITNNFIEDNEHYFSKIYVNLLLQEFIF